MAEVNDFATDTHRRVCAQCMYLRSASQIADVLRKVDPNVDEAAYERHGVEEYLADLEADGLVKNLGTFDDPESALKAQDKDKDVRDFQGSPEVFANSANSQLGYPFLDREAHWVMTNKGHAKLIGEAA